MTFVSFSFTCFVQGAGYSQSNSYFKSLILKLVFETMITITCFEMHLPSELYSAGTPYNLRRNKGTSLTRTLMYNATPKMRTP